MALHAGLAMEWNTKRIVPLLKDYYYMSTATGQTEFLLWTWCPEDGVRCFDDFSSEATVRSEFLLHQHFTENIPTAHPFPVHSGQHILSTSELKYKLSHNVTDR